MQREHLTEMVLMGLCMVAPACKEPAATAPAAEVQARPQVEDVVEDPPAFYGKSITLLGEVDTVFSERAFELEGNDWLFDHELLVVTRTPVRLGLEPLSNNDGVVVSGTVRKLTVAELEQELGWSPGDELELEVEIEQYPVLVADSISTTTYTARWSEQEQDREGVLLEMNFPLVTMLAEVLYGRSIELDDVEVRRVTGRGLWIGRSHRMQTLVSPPEGIDVTAIEPGDRITVRGIFRRMPPPDEAMARWELDPLVHAQIADEMVYIEATTLDVAEAPPRPEIALADVLESPFRYAGQVVAGKAKVLSVPSDRGFWLEVGEKDRLFAVLHEDDPEHAHIDINEGDVVKFEGLVLLPYSKSDLLLPLEQDAKDAIDQSGVFVSIHWSDIEKTDAS